MGIRVIDTKQLTVKNDVESVSSLVRVAFQDTNLNAGQVIKCLIQELQTIKSRWVNLRVDCHQDNTFAMHVTP